MKTKNFKFKSMALVLFALVLSSNVWGADVTLAEWTFSDTSYPANKTNFAATNGTCKSGSTFYLNGTGSTWNTSKPSYAFTAVTDIQITIKATEAISAGTKITFNVTTYYNKDKNAPMKGFNLTCKEGAGSFATTGLSVTSWSLSASSAIKTVVYTTQNEIAKDGTIVLNLTQTGQAGSGQGYMGPITVTMPEPATSYTVTKTLNNCSVTGTAIPATTTTGFSTTISANSGYQLPSTISVTGAFHTWNASTGALTISNVTGNVSITITATAAKTISSIAVTTSPKTNYTTCETLDLSGCVVTATYSDESTENVTSSCTFNPADGAALTKSVTSVAVSYEGKAATIPDISVTDGAKDTFVDNVQGTEDQYGECNGYTIPSCGDKTKDTGCEGEHYKFIGWSSERIQTGTQPTEPAGLLKAGASHNADGTTYYAVWAKEDE